MCREGIIFALTPPVILTDPTIKLHLKFMSLDLV